MSSFSESFISSGKQGGGATVLREGCDTVTRGTCVPASKQLRKSSWATSHLALLQLRLCQISAYTLFDINILGKAAALHLTLTYSVAEDVLNSAFRTLSTTALMSS
jgi:hypothetical protein